MTSILIEMALVSTRVQTIAKCISHLPKPEISMFEAIKKLLTQEL